MNAASIFIFLIPNFLLVALGKKCPTSIQDTNSAGIVGTLLLLHQQQRESVIVVAWVAHATTNKVSSSAGSSHATTNYQLQRDTSSAGTRAASSHFTRAASSLFPSSDGIYKAEKERLLLLIQTLEVKVETSILGTSELETKMEAELRLKELLREEELKWALRAKVRKIVQGRTTLNSFI